MVLARGSVESQFDAKSNWLAYGQHHEGRIYYLRRGIGLANGVVDGSR
jgi:hypothetical protein